MHYGSVPNDMPITEYSNHIVKNIDAAIQHFGDLGHPVYLFDHSMGNIYFLMMERNFESLPGVRKYLKGRIGANPFFGEEAKHATLGFMDNVILPSGQGPAERALFFAARRVIPLDSKFGVRNRGIGLSEWLISKDSNIRDRVWKATKGRILTLMSSLGSLPHLNRIPIERALNRLPAKIFAIQVHSALIESKAFDRQTRFPNMESHDIPIMILKSERDSVAKYVKRIYDNSHAQVIDITDDGEKDLFREHLYHMVNPLLTTVIIEGFVSQIEAKNAEGEKNSSLMRSAFLLFLACLLTQQTFGQKTSFEQEDHPTPPDYSRLENWSALPFREDVADVLPKGESWFSDSLKNVDVFYVHPTIYQKGPLWNADLGMKRINRRVDKYPVRLQASVFNNSCRVYAPRYRQAVVKVFYERSEDGDRALDLAYQDVKNAFKYFLDNYSQNRPFIIAGHSQGTHHREDSSRK